MRPAPVPRLLATTILVSVLLANFGSAEQRQFRGRTDLVRFDVLVLDDREQPVGGLTKDDFVIVDKGVEYQAELLEEFVVETPATAGAPWTRDIAPDIATNVTDERRLFIIVLDDAMLPPDSFAFMNSKTAAHAVIADVDVPDFTADGVRLSGLFVGTDPAPESAPRDALTALLPIVPTTLRTFGDGTRATAFVRVAQGGRSTLVPVRVVATIRDGSDRLVYERAWILEPGAFVAQRQADVLIEIPLDDLTAGPHLLEVSLPDHPGHERVRTLRFAR